MRWTALEAAVLKATKELGSPCSGDTVVVGLSGGPDSVALTHALVELSRERGFAVVAAHLDHALRDGSAEDAVFSAELARALSIRFFAARVDVKGRARQKGCGVEEAARLERYAFLRSVKEEVGAVAIAVAHTRDDQAETLLMRLMRGSGSLGLSAMRPLSAGILRPLLEVSRKDVLAHLARRNLHYREDQSNADMSILRNRIRHELIPYLESRVNPDVRGALARAASLLAEEAALLDGLAEKISLVELLPGGGVAIARKELADAPRAVARVALRHAIEKAGGLRSVSKLHVDKILALAASKGRPRRLPLPGGREVVVRDQKVLVERCRVSEPARGVEPLAEARL